MPPTLPAPLERLRAAPASAALMALQVAILGLVAWRLGSPGRTDVLLEAGALERGRVWAGEPWRLVTAALLHVGPLHLAANVAFGWGWYRIVEQALGPARFLALWLASAVGASAASLLLQDVVSAGASGALFGMVGATLALHRRLLPGWRAFARSPAVIHQAVSLGLFTAVTLLARVPIDHAAHAGGLVTGAAGAWIASRPAAAGEPHRPGAAWAAFGAVLLAVALAAAWPRPGVTAWEALSAERATLEALRREDLAAAAAAARPLEEDGWRGPGAQLVRAQLLEARGDLPGALEALRPLLAGATGDDPDTSAARRAVARRLLFRIGYRYYAGDGAPLEPRRGYDLIREACAAGDDGACRAEREIRTGVPTPAAP